MPKHILIVDDEPQIRGLLSKLLTASGYRVTPASSAPEAEEVVAKDPPDLIMSDLQLEYGDGLELIKKLKAVVPDTPVILLTGVLFDPQVARTAINKEVSVYLEKTVPLKRILEEIRRLLGETPPGDTTKK